MVLSSCYQTRRTGQTTGTDAMITLRHLSTFLTVLFLSISCSAVELAFFDVDCNGGVYLYTTKVLAKTDHITVFSDNQNKSCCRTFFGRDFLKVDKSEQVSSDDDGRTVIRYKGTAVNQGVSKSETQQASAAVIGKIKPLSRGREGFKLMASSQRYVVESCYGTEGKNLYLKSQGKLIQHLYYYFNLDIETNCK